jgi:hypothetical protein
MILETIQRSAEIVAQAEFASLVATTLMFVVVALVAWLMYTLISKRDIFGNGSTHFTGRFFHMCKYVFFLPGWSVLWFIVYAVLLQVLSNNPASATLLGSVMIVAGIRIAAYTKNEVANEIASILPFTLVAAIMANPNFITFGTVANSFALLGSDIHIVIQYIAFLVFVEWSLRIALWAHGKTKAYLDGRYLLPFGTIEAPEIVREVRE